jgi:ABC-type cobalamin transport system permease subunit
MASVSVGSLILGALVLTAFALAMSRRSLGLSALLCFLALGFLGYAVAEWAHLSP